MMTSCMRRAWSWIVLACLAQVVAISAGSIDVMYMPKYNLVVCACAKCGSTSLYTWLYAASHKGDTWPFKGAPFVQELTSSRWDGLWKNLAQLSQDQQTAIFDNNTTLSVALTRKPIDRLISAWKSKLKCEAKGYGGTDLADRELFTPQLLRILPSFSISSALPSHPGRPMNYAGRKCLYFEEFVDVMSHIHEEKKVTRLDQHFVPQQRVCFKRFGLTRWKFVVDVDVLVPGHPALIAIGNRLFPGSEIANAFPHLHESSGRDGVKPDKNEMMRYLFPDSFKILESITKTETCELGFTTCDDKEQIDNTTKQ